MSREPTPPFLLSVPFFGPEALMRRCVAEARPGGLYLEFGVATGTSLRRLREFIPLETRIYGFDWFQGLPEAWNEHPVGDFATGARIELPNVKLVEGLFADTLPGFLAEHGEPVSFVHIDCDLYASTAYVLFALRERIGPGTTILFDEYFGYGGWQGHEHKAFNEFIAATELRVGFIGCDRLYRLGVKIRERARP